MLDALLDRSIVFSFDRTGFQRHARDFRPFTPRPLGDVLITGGTSGIGLAAARTLADQGAQVHLLARDPERGLRAATQTGGRFTSVDLGDLEAVRAAAAAVTRPVDAVVLNAGAMPRTRTLTAQGHELTWASQVLGHLLLLRHLRARGLLDGARVLWVSSGGMYTQRLDLRDLTRAQGYQRHTVYANAKRAQVLLAHHLAARWPEVLHGSMHPGWVDTEAVRHAMPVFYRLTAPILRTPAQGADTVCWWVATPDPPPTGRFWFDRAPAPEHLRAHTRRSDPDALVARVFADTEPFLR